MVAGVADSSGGDADDHQLQEVCRGQLEPFPTFLHRWSHFENFSVVGAIILPVVGAVCTVLEEPPSFPLLHVIEVHHHRAMRPEKPASLFSRPDQRLARSWLDVLAET